MAYIKCKASHSLEKTANYVLKDEDEKVAHKESTNFCPEDFAEYCKQKNRLYYFRKSRQKNSREAYHIIQSFPSGLKVPIEVCIEIAKELMRLFRPDHDYLLCVHTDKKHIHNHIVMDSIDNATQTKFRNTKKDLEKLREISDEICLKHGLPIIEFKEKIKKENKIEDKEKNLNNREILKNDLEEAIRNSNNYAELLAYMVTKSYLYKNAWKNEGKYLAFKREDWGRFIRSHELGDKYSRDSLMSEDEKNKVYKKTYKLNKKIEDAINASKNIDDFISLMKRKHYYTQVKTTKQYGKFFVFKHINSKKYIPSYILGDYLYHDVEKRINDLNKPFREVLIEDIKYALEHNQSYLDFINYMIHKANCEVINSELTNKKILGFKPRNARQFFRINKLNIFDKPINKFDIARMYGELGKTEIEKADKDQGKETKEYDKGKYDIELDIENNKEDDRKYNKKDDMEWDFER